MMQPLVTLTSHGSVHYFHFYLEVKSRLVEHVGVTWASHRSRYRQRRRFIAVYVSVPFNVKRNTLT